ncbi:MAG: magnesium chelatase subunit [Acidobacteriota bacterium]|jgi:magnesium chelatase subunit D|nr:magnesium chelatase subunit [Acidobacteriota bacterium]
MKRRAPVAQMKAQHQPRTPPPVYPFTRIVGQEEMKLALLLNVIDASIGGVLIMGHRGTGKSTAVRALADLLPKRKRVRDCLYGCDPQDRMNLCDECQARLSSGEKLSHARAPVPVVELPLGATEDRVCGTVNIERALKEGVKAFEAGLLARANRGFLYIDEVNLLEDHLIDLLLDVSATGRNVVEREGISLEHPSRFVLVGSGNPEEGELRPQLLDRFGLHVEVKTATDLDERVMIVEQREAFERDPAQFLAHSASEQESLRRRLARARKKLPEVELARELLRHIAELCQQLKIDGHRGELTIARAARALAAFEGRKAVSAEDVRRVATMALRHRLRRDPLEQTGSSARIDQQLDKLLPQSGDAEETKGMDNAHEEDEPAPSSTPRGSGGNGAGGRSRPGRNVEGVKNDEAKRDAPPALDAELPERSLDAVGRTERKQTALPQSRQSRAKAHPNSENARRGRYVRASPNRTFGAKLALDATLRAAAGAGDGGWGLGVRKDNPALNPQPLTPIPLHALRYKRFKQKAGTLFIFAVDTSGSMALNRIAQAKGALVRLLQQSYIKRDRVALVSFRGQEADVMLRPSGSAMLAKRILDSLSIGGATPIAAGLASALEIARSVRRESTERIVLLLFTDGRANVSLRIDGSLRGDARQREIESELERIGAALHQLGVTTIVVDTRNRFTSGGEGQKLAGMIEGRYVYLSSVPSTGEQFTSLVRQARQSHS